MIGQLWIQSCFVSLFLTMSLPLELLAAVLVHLIPLRRRPHFLLRMALGLAGVVLAFVLGMSVLIMGSSLLSHELGEIYTRIVYSIFAYLLALLFVLLCGKLSLSEALYCTTNAYLTQHIAYCAYTLIFTDSGHRSVRANFWWYLLIYGGVYFLCYWLFARRIPVHGHFDVKVTHSLGMTGSALAVALLLSAAAQQLEETSRDYYRLCLLYALFCCFYVLGAQLSQQRRVTLQKKLNVQQQLWLQQQEQYRLATQNAEIINQKCHDLKHQIAALKLISDQAQRDASIRTLEQSVMIYDSIVETGNKILDAVLTEKSLLCEARGIELTCIADGHALDVLDAVDLYTLIGNALDNAIESAGALPDPELRTIGVSIFARAGMRFIQIENCYQGELIFEGGLPCSTKEHNGYHGFGLKGIRQIAEKYDGFLTVQAKEGIFLLRVTFP